MLSQKIGCPRVGIGFPLFRCVGVLRPQFDPKAMILHAQKTHALFFTLDSVYCDV